MLSNLWYNRTTFAICIYTFLSVLSFILSWCHLKFSLCCISFYLNAISICFYLQLRLSDLSFLMWPPVCLAFCLSCLMLSFFLSISLSFLLALSFSLLVSLSFFLSFFLCSSYQTILNLFSGTINFLHFTFLLLTYKKFYFNN